MKKITLISLLVLMISAISFAQDLKPKKDKATKKYGYLNSAKEWIIQPRFDKAAKFDGNTATIVMSKKTGLIDRTGKIILEPQFDNIAKFKNGFALIKKNKLYGFINTSGKVICQPVYNKIEKFGSNGIATITYKKKLGLIKNNGTVLLEPSFDKIGNFSGNTANVENNDLWGLIDSNGEIIFKPEFTSKMVFRDGIAIVQKSNKYGIVKKDGTVIHDFNLLTAVYEGFNYYIKKNNRNWVICNAYAEPVSKEFAELSKTGGKFIKNGMIKASNGSKWGFINNSGQELIPFKFDQIGIDGFKNGYCAIKIGGKWGYIKKNGTYFKTPQYEDANGFMMIMGEPMASVTFKGKKYTLNAKTGELKLKPGQEEAVKAPAATPVQASTTKKPSTTARPTTNWILGKWIVTEERMGGKAKTGKNTKYVSFVIR